MQSYFELGLGHGMCKSAAEREMSTGEIAGRVGAGGVGLVGLRTGLPRAFGTRMLYHGTGKDAAKSIKQTGLDPSFGGGATGASSALEKATGSNVDHFYDASRGKVHATEFKPIARFFENIQGGGMEKIVERSKLLSGELTGEAPTGLRKVKEIAGLIKDQAKMMFSSDGGVLSMPMSEMEYDDIFKFVVDSDAAAPGIGRTMAATTEKAIPSSMIRGGKDFSYMNRMGRILGDLPASIKNNPKRFLLGAGLTALGVGGAHHAATGGGNRDYWG